MYRTPRRPVKRQESRKSRRGSPPPSPLTLDLPPLLTSLLTPTPPPGPLPPLSFPPHPCPRTPVHSRRRRGRQDVLTRVRPPKRRRRPHPARGRRGRIFVGTGTGDGGVQQGIQDRCRWSWGGSPRVPDDRVGEVVRGFRPPESTEKAEGVVCQVFPVPKTAGT